MSADHDHGHAPADFNRAFAIGIALNVAFVAIERFTAGRSTRWPCWPTPRTT
jgi:hypothetical protein